MPRTQAQFEKMREATRERIRGAALDLFAEKGLAKTSVQDIARRAEVSAGLLYRHYASKDDVFLEIVEEARAGLVGMKARFETGAPRETLIAQAEEIVRDIESDAFGRTMTVVTRALLMGDARLAPLIETDRAMIAALANMIRRGQAAGQFRAGDPRKMACAFLSTVQGVFVLKGALGDAFAPPDAALLTAALLKEGI